MTTGAIVLAGGRSARFGSDKRRALVDGVPILERVIRAVSAVSDEVVLVVEPGGGSLAVASRATRQGSPLVVVEDRVRHAGPLAALAVGLRAARGSRVVVVAGDMPWLEPDVLGALLGTVEVGGTWSLEAPPGDPDQPIFPFAGLTADLLEATESLLRLGERRLGGLLLTSGGGRLPAETWLALDPGGRTIADVDTPGDLPGGPGA